ncbi:MAG TPA: hypothetical protein VEA36_00790 [Candidatus Paceibacterota bacterium]|nr:hypothetical protein [Candidatus Paceibacterota bacterium]
MRLRVLLGQRLHAGDPHDTNRRCMFPSGTILDGGVERIGRRKWLMFGSPSGFGLPLRKQPSERHIISLGEAIRREVVSAEPLEYGA